MPNQNNSSPSRPKVAIVGAGPGGLTAAMLLSAKGFDVHVFERNDHVGGRCSTETIGEFKIDVGPTVLTMKHMIDELFEHVGKNVNDYLEFHNLELMYRIHFANKKNKEQQSDNKDSTINVYSNHEKMKQELSEKYPEDVEGYERFMEVEGKRYQKLMPALQRDYSSFWSLMSKEIRDSVPYLGLHRNLFSILEQDYFKNPEVCSSFTFQAKYLGMSPWKCPGPFMIIPYMEHAFGIHHVTGGLSEIYRQMAKVTEELGGTIHLNSPIQQLQVNYDEAKPKASGLILEDGSTFEADEVIVNADFGYAVNHLFPERSLSFWKPEKLDKYEFSCSVFMIYLGVDCVYDHLPHHNISFGRKDFKESVDEVFEHHQVSDDPFIYLCNPSRIDKTMAPEGKSILYFLVAVPNTRFLDASYWEQEAEHYKNQILDHAEERFELTNLRKHIEVEKVIPPSNWESDYNVYAGAIFSMAHTTWQMLYFRPHNKFEEMDHCYIVGGNTHPGSGLPTIMESSRIAARLMCQEYDIQF